MRTGLKNGTGVGKHTLWPVVVKENMKKNGRNEAENERNTQHVYVEKVDFLKWCFVVGLLTATQPSAMTRNSTVRGAWN